MSSIPAMHLLEEGYDIRTVQELLAQADGWLHARAESRGSGGAESSRPAVTGRDRWFAGERRA
jgi:hypothetical protein